LAVSRDFLVVSTPPAVELSIIGNQLLTGHPMADPQGFRNQSYTTPPALTSTSLNGVYFMAVPRYSSSGIRSGPRGPSILECTLALSVIFGLMFVTYRIMNLGAPAGLPAPVNQTAESDTTVAKTETLPSAPDASDTKTP
jgi:hypothetical protein